jgi:hypothetical protein
VAVGALIKVMDANKKSIALKTAINNMNFTLESMSRELRVGKNYQCIDLSGSINFDTTTNILILADCPEKTNWIIAFNSSKRSPLPSSSLECNLIYAYKYFNDSGKSRLQKAEQKSCLDNVSDFQDVVSPEVTLLRSLVSVTNLNQQPYVTLFFNGSVGIKNREKTEFSIQTSVSQRLPK